MGDKNEYDEQDVKEALNRKTQDGPGSLDNLPEDDYSVGASK